MTTHCNCNEFTNLRKQHKDVFVKDPTYGWVLSWIELTEEKGYTQVNRYGIPIVYCMMCGKLLKK